MYKIWNSNHLILKIMKKKIFFLMMSFGSNVTFFKTLFLYLHNYVLLIRITGVRGTIGLRKKTQLLGLTMIHKVYNILTIYFNLRTCHHQVVSCRSESRYFQLGRFRVRGLGGGGGGQIIANIIDNQEPKTYPQTSTNYVFTVVNSDN